MFFQDEYEEALEKLRQALAAPSLALPPEQHKLIARLKAARGSDRHGRQYYHPPSTRARWSAERKAASKLRRSTFGGA